MRIKKLFPLVILFIICHSCMSDAPLGDNETDTLPQYRLVKKDSFKLDVSNDAFTQTDYHPDFGYLLMGLQSNDIVIFDKNFKETGRFNRKGPGKEEYPSTFEVQASFSDDGNILIQTDSYLKKYTTKGKFIQSHSIKDAGFSFIPAYGKGNVVTQAKGEPYILLNGGTIIEPEYVNHNFFTKNHNITALHTKTGQWKSGVVPPPDSRYANYNEYGLLIPRVNNMGIFYDVDKVGNLFAAFPYEPVIYQFDVPELSYQGSILLRPQHFSKKIKGPRSDEIKRSTKPFSNKLFQSFSSYCGVFSLDSWGEKSFATVYFSHPNSEDIVLDDRTKYIQLFKNGKKAAQDILFPKHFGYLDVILDIDHILVSKKSDDRATTVVTYKYALEKVRE